MTRWARSGSTQKHKKPPEDPTPWEEFVTQKRLKSNADRRHSQQVKANELDQNVTAAASSDATLASKNKKSWKKKWKLLSMKKSEIFQSPDLIEVAESKNNNEAQQVQKNKATILSKKKKNKKKIKAVKGQSIVDADTDVDIQSEITVSKEEIREYKKQMKRKKREASDSAQDKKMKLDSAEESHSTENKTMKLSDVEEPDSFNLKLPKETSLKELRIEKTKFLDRLRQKRSDNGIILLPPKIERKLYNMKKGLRNKGVPGENIRDIIRQVRRKEELKFRKTLKTCFKCRKTGHVMADCPLLNGDSEEGTGICFKCGSTEHTSYRCSAKTAGFPFAKCFICQTQGHLSRDCPQNKHGAYPKGGNCKACGSINHLKKDCPTLQNKDADEEITVGTLTDMTSVEEIEDYDQAQYVKKKPKVVKF